VGSSNEAEPLGFDLKAPHLGRGGSLLLSHRKDLLAAHLLFDTLYTPPFDYIMERRENFLSSPLDGGLISRAPKG